jgi:ABC-type sugar transport system permease subunit
MRVSHARRERHPEGADNMSQMVSRLEGTGLLRLLQKRPHVKASQWRNWATAWTFIAPYVIILTVFTLISVVVAFYLSFFRVNFGFTAPIFAGAHNYSVIWYDITHSGNFIISVKNIIFYAIGVVILQTILALALALLLNQKVRSLGLFRTAIYLPALTSSVAISLIFLWLYQPQGGVNFVLSIIGIHGPAWLENTRSALPALMLLNIWTTAPTFMIVYRAALQDIPQGLYEAARVDGASGWRLLWNITIPLLRPTTFVVVALGTIGAFQMFDQAFIMTAGGPVNATLTPVLEIYDAAFQENLMGLACAEAFALFVIIFALTILQKKYIDVQIEY